MGDYPENEAVQNLHNDACEFIEIPSSINAFYPQIDSASIHLFIKFGVSKFKIILRNNIQHQLTSEYCLNIFEVLTIASTMQPTPVSPKSDTKNAHISAYLSNSNEESEHNFEMKHFIESPKAKRKQIIEDIETLVIKILHDITTENNIKLLIPNSRILSNFEIENGALQIKNQPCNAYTTVSFNYLRCRHHLATILYVLSEIYHLLITNTTCTERELYYDNIELAENQSNIKSAIRDVCSILKVSPWELGIRSSSKGLMAGTIRLHMCNHIIIDCYINDGPSLIPDVLSIQFIETTAKFVLIVEKDTIFEKLLKQNILLQINSDIIIITGKGYPDLNTRLLIKKIWNDFRLPIYALVDADPFGIDIMLVYRFGSRAMALNADQLACPEIRWVGVHPSEIETLAIPSIALTKRDKMKMMEILQRPYIDSHIRKEIEILQRLNCKAEIEGVARFSTNFLVSDYIPKKIKMNLAL